MNLARRIWWGLVLTVISAVTLTGIVGWLGARSLLMERLDEGMVRRSNHTAERPHMIFRFVSGSRFGDAPLMRLIAPDGSTAFVTDTWPADCDPPTDERLITIAFGEHRYRCYTTTVETDGDEPRRWRGDPPPEIAPGTKLQVLTDLDDIEQDLGQVALALTVVGGVVIILSLLLAARLCDALLAPLARLIGGIDALDSDRLDQRLDREHLPGELQRIAGSVDQLLDRLADARIRERRLLGDIAHELRSPVAAILSRLGFAQGDDPILIELRQQSESLAKRLDALLLLTRLDDAGLQIQRRPCDLPEAVAEAWAPLAASAGERGIGLLIDEDCDDEALAAEPGLLHSCLVNLLGNAIAHGDADRSIQITWHNGQLIVRNPAGSAEPGERPQATRAFWRQDVARSGDGRHAGLGLAIVARIVALHDGRITVRVDDDHHFVVSITWPQADS